MSQQFSTMQTDVFDRLSKLSTSTFMTSTMVKRWLNMAMHWALSYKRWPHLQYKDSADLIDATGKYPYPSGMKLTSIFLVRVNSERYAKINFESYLKYLEENPTGEDKVWAEFDEYVYINGNACTVGETIEMYGQKSVSDLSTDANTTPFTGKEESADEAIIVRAVAIGLEKMEDKDALAKSFKKEAEDILDLIWDRIMENAPKEVQKATPLLRKLNVIKGTTTENTNDNIGNF